MGKRTISVAMATYNGEKYIREQLMSILHQTAKVDEIVISDDGSKDHTLAVAEEVAASPDAKEVRFVFLTDNPRHGCGGNFEWAMSHCSGDLIFVCGQDDIWLPEKVETVSSVFRNHPDALCVMHDAEIIDAKGDKTGAEYKIYLGNCRPDKKGSGALAKIDDSMLESSVSRPLVAGISLCISKDLMQHLHPFPTHAEDQWIEFSAILNRGCYFIDRVLTYYRKHEENASGSRSKGIKRVRFFIEGMKSVGGRKSSYIYNHEFGKLCIERLEESSREDDPAYNTAKRVYEIGCKKNEALERGGVSGAIALIALYQKDIRYRRIGFWSFFFDLMFVLKN